VRSTPEDRIRDADGPEPRIRRDRSADLVAFARTWTALPRGGGLDLEWVV